MKAFTNCKSYLDYLTVIKESIINDDKINKDNIDRLSFLTLIKDLEDQKKIINVMNQIDSELSFNGAKSNEMFKKIDYILSLGELFCEYNPLVKDLTCEELFTLVYGEYSKITDDNRELLPLFTNKYLLDAIKRQNDNDIRNKKYNVFGISDYFFMIKQHYNKEPFDLNNQDKVNEFVVRIIEKMNNNTLHNGVRNMLEYWSSKEVEELKRRASV